MIIYLSLGLLTLIVALLAWRVYRNECLAMEESRMLETLEVHVDRLERGSVHGQAAYDFLKTPMAKRDYNTKVLKNIADRIRLTAKSGKSQMSVADSEALDKIIEEVG